MSGQGMGQQGGGGHDANQDHGAHAPNSVPPEWRRRILGAFFAGCIILVVVDFMYHRHEYHDWEALPAFYPLFGFIGISALILVSKGLRRLVMRPEDYYDHPVYGDDAGGLGADDGNDAGATDDPHGGAHAD